MKYNITLKREEHYCPVDKSLLMNTASAFDVHYDPTVDKSFHSFTLDPLVIQEHLYHWTITGDILLNEIGEDCTVDIPYMRNFFRSLQNVNSIAIKEFELEKLGLELALPIERPPKIYLDILAHLPHFSYVTDRQVMLNHGSYSLTASEQEEMLLYKLSLNNCRVVLEQGYKANILLQRTFHYNLMSLWSSLLLKELLIPIISDLRDNSYLPELAEAVYWKARELNIKD